MKNPFGQHHQGQYMVNHYNNAVKKAAEYEIMINTHEPIKDTGLTRTYPNWVSREGVQGMEYNAWSEGNPPDHTTILPFTRMMAGPIDYTPGIFDVNIPQKPNNRVHTTRAKQLALYVIISSPIQMVTDLPENYKDENGNIYPEFQFIKDVPTTWDQIIVPQAEIGDFVTIVRQSGDDWYIGSITDENARDLDIALDFLDQNKKYVAEIYQDGLDADWVTNPNPVSIHKVIVDSSDTLVASLATSGGQAVRLYPATENDLLTLPDYQKPTIEISYLNIPNEVYSNDTLNLDLRVKNNGLVFVSKEINLIMDGSIVLSKQVRLSPNSTKDITLTFDEIFEPKSLTINVNDLEPFIVIIKPREATFDYSNLTVSLINKMVTISGVVTNSGTYEGSEQVKLFVNGELAEIKTITLGAQPGGMSQVVSFQYEITQDGIYEFTIGDLPTKRIAYPQVELSNWLFHRGDDMRWKDPSFDDQSWERVTLPSKWESHSNYYEDNCYGWYRKSLYIPDSWQGYSLKVTLGKIDDVDQTYFNGQLIGQHGTFPDEHGVGMQTAWQEVREYIIPKELIQYGNSNLISIRIYDGVVDGGLYEGPIKIELIK